MTKYTLTPEHKAQIPAWRDYWISKIMSTETMSKEDKNIVAENIVKLYKHAYLTPPKNIVFVSSPFVAKFATGFAAALCHLRENNELPKQYLKGNLKKSESKIYNLILEATLAAAKESTEINTIDLTISDEDFKNNSYIKSNSDNSTWIDFDTKASVQVAKDLGLDKFGLECAQEAWYLYQGGNYWGSFDCFLSFFRHIVQLDIDYSKWDAWEQLSLHSSVRYVHKDFVIISDKPTVLLVDSANQPHNANGPFCVWRDNTALYSVHGVRVPKWIVTNKELITAALIDKEPNAEIRRVMLEFFGFNRYIEETGAKVVAEDLDQYGRPRRLLVKELKNDEALVRIEVTNSSPELTDGSYKKYLIPVHPELKPLRTVLNADGTVNKQLSKEATDAGKAQKFTCKNAVASTFGLYGEEYGLEGQIRQGDVLIRMFTGESSKTPFRES